MLVNSLLISSAETGDSESPAQVILRVLKDMETHRGIDKASPKCLEVGRKVNGGPWN